MFKLFIETLDPEDRSVESPILEIIVKKPRSPNYFLGYLLAVRIEDWGGRTLRQFKPENLKHPDLFTPYTPLSR